MKILLASSNPGKLREYRELAVGSALDLDLIPNFRELPAFEESAPTFAENAAGKALHYSRFTNETVIADDLRNRSSHSEGRYPLPDTEQ